MYMLKNACTAKAREGLFELTTEYTFNVQHPGVQATVVINEGAYKEAAHFERHVKEEMKRLNLTSWSVQVKMPTMWRQDLYHNGSVKIEADWSSKQKGSVKREAAAAADGSTPASSSRTVRQRPYQF